SVFEHAPPAIEAAVAIQRSLSERIWSDGVDVRVRAGIHSGRPTLTDTGYVGLSVHTVARLCSVAHGGQIVVSRTTKSAVTGSMPAGIRLRGLGGPPLAGLSQSEALFQVHAEGLPTAFPPLRAR